MRRAFSCGKGRKYLVYYGAARAYQNERSFSMYCTRKVNDDYTWVGADGRRLAMFEGVFDVPNGISFNSYLLRDEKTVLFDTTDAPHLPGKSPPCAGGAVAGLRGGTPHGAGSHGGAGGAGAALPGGADLLQRYGQDHDDPVLRHRPSGAHPCGEGGGYPLHRAAHAALYCGSHGPLAGGTDDL